MRSQIVEFFNLQSAIEINVADSGIGIKSEDQERVFGEFEQLDSTYARQQEGTGLGLALTRRLVELHGGGIWVESKGEGKGSTFTFVIPIEAERRKSEAVTDPEEPLSSRSYMVNDSRPLVLIVEEDRQRLNSHVQAIASKSASGKEDLLRALERLAKRKPTR